MNLLSLTKSIMIDLKHIDLSLSMSLSIES